MSTYLRSVGFRLAGAVAGGALWVGLIVWALANFDSPVGLPDSLQATWPFWVIAGLIAVGTYLVRRRLGPGPGWGMFFIGVFAPFVGLSLNARVGDGALWFWLAVAIVILIPIPSRRRGDAAPVT